MIDLSAAEARRLALAAAGLAAPRPARKGPAALAAMFDRLGMVQIDSVNVLARAHYMPAFARLGDYDADILDRAAQGPRRRLFEYWGHEAALIRTDLQPCLRWRMARARAGTGIYGGLSRFAAERADFIEAVLRQVAARGPLAARDLADGGKASGSWWGWSDGKRALEWLFWAGLVTTQARRGFERVYDLTERVLPEATALPTPDDAAAQRRLLGVAARALGVATLRDLRAYWRIKPDDASARLPELVEAGDLLPARVEGWREAAFVARDALPQRPRASALISPFDPLLWERDRAERLFGFRYRIEIYTPAHKREHGYYVLPFLLGDRFAARLDLKADRPRRTLVVAAAHLESGAHRGVTVEAVAAEVDRLASWLGLDAIEVRPSGDLAADLAANLTGSLAGTATSREPRLAADLRDTIADRG
jgi:uncharacterized protein YcaQ